MPGSFTQSATVIANQTATAGQYNGLRKDAIFNAGDYALATGVTNAFIVAIDSQMDTLTAGFVVKFKANIGNTTTATLTVNSLAAKSIKKGDGTDVASGDILTGQAVQVVYDGTNYQMISPNRPSFTSKFGGNGSDGPLIISSGTLTINCVLAQMVTKNYSSISITGTGRVVFTNTHTNGTVIIFKSQGDVTLTSSTIPYIDCSGLGGKGGIGAIANSNASGTDGYNGSFFLDNFTHIGTGGNGGAAAGGNGGASLSNTFTYTKSANMISLAKSLWIATGSGGGGGGSAGTGNCTAAGNGGAGGGAFRLECGGALNFTGAGGISVAGGVGAAGTDSTVNGTSGGGGGGGGSSGMALILANTITVNTGTVNTAGGNGGAGGNGKGSGGSDKGGGGGGAGGGYSGSGGGGGAGQAGTGTSGGTGDGSGGGGGGGNSGAVGGTNAGGAGGAGVASDNLLVALNTEF